MAKYEDHDFEKAVDDDLDNPKAHKIFCANCVNCKLVKIPVGNGSQYQLRVRCTAGVWNKKSGEEKLHKYFTLARRTCETCDHYVTMGDTRGFLRELRASLPTRDELYQV